MNELAFPIRSLDLFAGAGGGILAWKRLAILYPHNLASYHPQSGKSRRTSPCPTSWFKIL